MKRNPRKAAVCMIFLVAGFLAGRVSMRPAEVEIRWSPEPGWIEVYHQGELTSELCPQDGRPYDVLNDVLQGGPTLPRRLRPPARSRWQSWIRFACAGQK